MSNSDKNSCVYSDKIMADKLHDAIIASVRNEEKLTILVEQSLKIAENNNDSLALHDEKIEKNMVELWEILKNTQKDLHTLVTFGLKVVKYAAIVFGVLFVMIILLLGGETVLNKALNIF